MNADDAQMTGSCMSYSKIQRALDDEWGVAAAPPYSRGARIDQVLDQVRTIVREETRRAVEEIHYRLVDRLVAVLVGDSDEAIYIPPMMVRVNTGGLGSVRLRERWVFLDLKDPART